MRCIHKRQLVILLIENTQQYSIHMDIQQIYYQLLSSSNLIMWQTQDDILVIDGQMMIYLMHKQISFYHILISKISKKHVFAFLSPTSHLCFIIIMRNIKISFEHPSYIYPFKLNISAPPIHQIDRTTCKAAEESLESIKQQIILSAQQEKIISSFSVLFKVEFVHQYTTKLNERKAIDFLGHNCEQHYQYFSNLCRQRITIKQMLELNHYINRIPTIKMNEGEFSHQKWLNLTILFHTNFITSQKITADKEAIHQQLEAFVALYTLIQTLNQLIINDQSYSMQIRMMIPTIQDSFIQGYMTLTNLHLQQQALLMILTLSRSLLAYLKQRLAVDQSNPEHKESGGKKNPPSLIYWIINFNPNPKQQSKFDMLFNSLNIHTVFEIMVKLLSKTVNLIVIEDSLSFISSLFQQISGFGQLLFLITEAIRFQFPKTLSQLSNRIKIRQLKSTQMIKYNLQCDLSQIFGKVTIQPFKLKEMIKIQKSAQKVFNGTLREVNKAVAALYDDFQRYKKGKIIFKRKKKVGNLYEEQIQEREILNIEKLAEESHLHYKSQEIISMELFRENEELIKVNRWLEERLKKNEAVIAELLSLNQKDNVRAKLKQVSQVLNHKIQASFSSFPTIRFSQIIHGNQSNDKPLSQMHLKRTDSREMLQTKTNFDSKQQLSNRRSNPKYTLPPNSQNILLQIPRIDIPRQRERRNSFGSLKQIEMSRTSLIFQQANNKINKTIEEQQKSAGSHVLPLPPPLPSFMQLPPDISSLPPPPTLLLPPPPSLSLDLVPPPPLFLPNFQMPPLPMIPDLGGGLQKKEERENKVEMKSIGWNMLESTKIKNSFWQSISEPKLQLKKDELINYFGKNEKSFVPTKPATPQVKTILKPDRIKNVQIIMKKMKITQPHFPLIQDAFRSFNEQYLNQQFLNGILNLMPNSKERIQYMDLVLDGQNWSIADKFLAFLSKIDSLEEKINSILFKQQFQSIAVAFFNKAEEFVAFFQDLKEDKFFQVFLEFMLAVGNFLNEGTHRGNARAFRIQNIEKTYLLLGQDKQTSLFDYILDQMFQKDPTLFEWPSLANRSHSIVPLSVLCEDYSYFQKKCSLVNQCIILSEQDPLDESAPFFLPFYLKAREDVSIMKNQLQFASLIFKGVKQFYGDKLQSEEMAKLVIEFRNRVAQWRSKSKNRRDKK